MQTLESIINRYYHINHAINPDKNVSCLKAFDLTKLNEFEKEVGGTDVNLPYEDFLRETVYNFTKILLRAIRTRVYFDGAKMCDEADQELISICQSINKMVSQYYNEVSK